MMTLQEAPVLHLTFALLHVLLGHLGSSFVYRLRFGRSPMAYRSASAHSAHTRLTQLIAWMSALWGCGLISAAIWPAWLEMSWGRPLFHPPPLAGWLVAGLALVGMLTSQYGMGASFRIGVDPGEQPPPLHEGGLHRYSRNPIYVCSYLYLVGATLWSPSAFLLVTLGILGVLFHGLVLQEERYLSERLGASYLRYRQHVRRYF